MHSSINLGSVLKVLLHLKVQKKGSLENLSKAMFNAQVCLPYPSSMAAIVSWLCLELCSIFFRKANSLGGAHLSEMVTASKQPPGAFLEFFPKSCR